MCWSVYRVYFSGSVSVVEPLARDHVFLFDLSIYTTLKFVIERTYIYATSGPGQTQGSVPGQLCSAVGITAVLDG